MPPLFSTQLDLKLIKLVKENPVIYNPRHPKYSDSDTRELTWQKISDAMGRPTAEFAGIQCQIQFGDYNEEKHKPGFIENNAEYLPEQYCSSWGIEKKILKEYSKHVGVNELEAKHLYTKTARELPTYGVTFFLVKEKQKGKKKLVPRLLGINSDAILRLDETTKEILQQWPLTHVKTYHAGRGETFTLNFGDYTDKEYSVKTRDAFRIRDILEGYIDLIRKRMLANYNTSLNEQGYITQDSVSCGQASMVQHMSNNPMKIIEQSFVGPSKIVQYEPGQKASEGTQITTTYQIVTSDAANKQGSGVKGEVPMRSDMSRPFTRKLNRLNSNSVKLVTLLTEPSQGNMEQSQTIVDVMNTDMPDIRNGVQETLSKQSSAEEKKKLEDQLHELETLMKTLTESTTPGSLNPAEADDAAKQIADLTTRMYFSMNPETKRRSGLLRRSQPSFIADEKVEMNLRRASFIAATASANHALDNAGELIAQEYNGSPLDARRVEELEKSALDKMGKLNAAIAHYLLAHSNPKNIDYGAAVNSLNTIHELMPELAKDAQALSSVEDGKNRQELVHDIKKLCDAAKHVCSLSGVEEPQKLQEASAKYADVAGKLVFTFGRRSKPRADKENEVIALAKDVGANTAELLISAQGLTEMAAEEPAAADVDTIGAHTAAAAKDLITQAELNAPTIHEPHCQSALTAAAEALSSSAQQLAATWKPLVEHPSRHDIGEKLHIRTMDLAKALDRLRDSYANLGDVNDGKTSPNTEDEAQRLKFVMTLSKVKGSMQAAQDDLNEPLTYNVHDNEAKDAQSRLSQRLGQLNAAIASLLAATADRENPDYDTAEAAVHIINDLIPEVVKDAKVATVNQDTASRAALLDNIRALCDVTDTLCASTHGAHTQGFDDAVGKYTEASGKLRYVMNKRANPAREVQMLEQAKAACLQADLLAVGVQQLAGRAGGAREEVLEAQGAGLTGAAHAMLTVAQVWMPVKLHQGYARSAVPSQLTAPSISDPRCQSTLLAAVDKVSSLGRQLEDSWTPLRDDPEHGPQVLALTDARKHLEALLDNLRTSCQVPDEEPQSTDDCQTSEVADIQGPLQQQQKLQFINTMNGAKSKLADAQNKLNEPALAAKGSDLGKVEDRLAQRLGQLNAAIAALLAATADREKPDYAAAERAATTIAELMPLAIQDTKTASLDADAASRDAMLAHIKGLCDASQGICASSYGGNAQDLNDQVAKFADASGKLVYVVSPRANAQKEEEILSLSSAACGQASQLLSGVQQLAEGVEGVRGEVLDAKGGKVADAAQGLLQVAQLTAPSITSPHCRAALLSSVDNLSKADQQLAASLAPLHDDPKHKKQVQALQQALQRLEHQLDDLRKACDVSDVDNLQNPAQERQKLQFIKTMQGAKDKLADAHKELNKPTKPAKGSDMEKVQERLSQKLGQLNGAIAALLAATADRENPDYAAAEKSASIIAELMPHVIQDTKTASLGTDAASRDAMLAHIKDLCDASQGICASSYGGNTQALNDQVAKFADASGKLVYVVSPQANAQKEEQILDLSSAACGQASQLLSGVQQLAEGVEGPRGEALDAQGGKVADAAQGLLHVAQLTAPSITSPHCRVALLSSVDNLSKADQQLAASLAPLHDDPKHKKQVQALQQALQRLENQLDDLRKACDVSDVNNLQNAKERQKLQFIKTMQGAKDRLADAHKELNKPTKPAKGSDMEKVQDRLSQKLGQLNGAIAALLAATADRENPDYAAAEKSASTIAELMPHVIQDTKTASLGADAASRDAMLAHIKDLCDASQGICASSYGGNAQDLNDQVAKFADASGKLVYVVSPRANAQKEEQILHLSNAACGQASQLLSGVQQLAEGVEGARGEALDAQGGNVADAAQGLHHVAQLTAPSITSPHCRAALLSSVDNLSKADQQLAASLDPLHDDPKHKKQVQMLQQALQRLEDQLNDLRKACDVSDVDNLQNPAKERQKLQFIKTMQGAKDKLAGAHKELNKPSKPAKGSDMDKVQERLSQKLGQLNGATAALLAATADRENPDYAAAEKSASTIALLMPHVIQDVKTASLGADVASRDAMLAHIKDLCDASQGICASSYGGNAQNLNDQVAKFADASGKLVYVVSPRTNAQKEEQILGLSSTACGQASRLLSGVQQLAEGVEGPRGEALDAQGGKVADAAQGLLQVAQLTAPTIISPHCRAALLSSVDNLSKADQQLAASLAPLHDDPKHKKQVQALQQALQRLEDQLNYLRKASDVSDVDNLQNPAQERRKLQFIKTMQGAKDKLADAHKELNKPTKPAKGSDMDKVQERLSQKLGQLNGAIAALLAATADRENPDYAAAEKSASIIAELMPHVIQDTKTASLGADAASRDAMLAHIKDLCDASQGICASSYGGNAQDLNDQVAKFADASGKLVYVVSPRANAQKEEQILDLSSAACGQVSQLLSGVQQLAEGVKGAWGEALDVLGGKVADAAQGLLQVAQITAPSISSPQCQKTLLSSVDNLTNTSEQLAASLAPLVADPHHGPQARKLNQALQALQAQLEQLRKTCLLPDNSPPSSLKKPPPPARTPHTAHNRRPSIDITQDFLTRLRCEEGLAQANPNVPPSPTTVTSTSGPGQAKVKASPARNTDDDKRLHQQFVTSMDEAERSVKQHEASLMKLCRLESGAGPALSQSEMMRKQEALQHHLALAGVEVAHLVAANYADKTDYATASKSTKALPQLMHYIVQDGVQLSDNVNDMARKAFLYDLLRLCEAAGNICNAAKSDRQKLNDAAVQFGDTSTKLLYVVSNDVDPALEKEIISRAKAIGDSASRLALDAAGIAGAASGTANASVQDICDAGTACVDAAGKVVYTAKLTAPSIHEPPCQDALVSSTENLSAKLQTFADSWKPLSADPQQAKTIKDLTKEADNLEKILEGLRNDIKGGNIGRRREMEQLLIENTPLRQLTVQILDDAKLTAESSDLSPSQKIEYAAYADKLTAALRALDLANARCKKTPHDTNKRRELENAIQDLQMTLLQSRPNRGDKGNSNIVDLRDFIEEVSAEANNMCAAASAVKVPTAQDQQTLEEVKAKCNVIQNKAYSVMHADSTGDADSTFSDVLEVDQFGQECNDVINQINADLKGMEDPKAKRLLLTKMLPLVESCNMLRFATKSGISTEASASLDSSLDALDDIEARVIPSIVRDANSAGVALHSKPFLGGNSTATIKLCREISSASPGVAPHIVTAYIADAALRADTADPDEKNKLLKHLYKLVHLLKTLTVTSSMRSATWQPVDGPQVATIIEQILQEISSPESKFGAKPGETKNMIINEKDIAMLLVPSAPKILGDQKQQEEKLIQLAAKLSSMSGAIGASVTSPTALARSAHATAATALELDGIARACTIQNHMHKKRVDNAAKEMSFATYTVLKTAESASQDPTNPNVKRRLAEACEMLNRNIDKLVSACSSSPPLQQQCGALSRDVTLALGGLQPVPTGAATFEESCNVLDQQRENIYKLQNDQPLARKEFMKNLQDVGAAVRKSTECASHCAYYIAISDLHKELAKTGLVDVPQTQKSIEQIQDSCMAIIGSSSIYQAAEEKEDLHKRVQDLSGALDKAQVMVTDGDVRRNLARARSCVADAAEELEVDLKDTGDMGKITPKAVKLLEAVSQAHSTVEQSPLVPRVGHMTPDNKARCDELINNSKSLLSSTQALLKDVSSSPEEPETMTWVSFSTSRKKLLQAYDALVNSVKKNGHRAGILEKAPEEPKEEVKKSYIETQVDLANKWLKSPASKAEAKAVGQQAVRNVVDIARQMSEDLKGSEREEVRNVITETEELLCECSKKYDHEKNSVLMDRLKELKKSIQRGVVTRVVEDFIEAEAPLADLEILTDSEKDETKRKFILERKIASLLAQLGRVTRTARFVAGAAQHQQVGVELTHCSEQAELLAPMLVQAAQQRIDYPDDKVVIENYKTLLGKYADCISKVRDVCDRAVDPMEFVQAAGDTMQRMREDMQHNNDPQKCAYTSSAITKLANRVIHVSMSSNAVQSDPELQKALVAAKQRLHAVTPAPNTRASRLPDWRESTAEILRTTGDVESALGGENIFKKQPTTANQSIYSAARDMHECVREWSARDNEIVAVARRMAVLMARLSEYMETDRKDALISTSKSIVQESQEVTELAKKLAHECSDVRIKTIQEVVKAAAGASVKIMSQRGPRLRWNLLQTCERIPTISGQLKMLTTVKGSSLGQQGLEADKEAMDMLVGNAQSLMMSIQEVVKAAAGASVKIMSQRGPRLRWVRKNFY